LEISSDAASTQLRIDNDDRICNRVENLRQTLKSWALVNVLQNLSCELIVVDNVSSGHR
jgi:stage III sporulation protein SpoIIIAA